MIVFKNNILFRRLTMIDWVSIVGDTVFYLAFINYVSSFDFAKTAIFYITISETVPQFMQIFLGTIADFQKNRVLKYMIFSILRFLMYFIIAIAFMEFTFSLNLVLMVCVLNTLSDILGFFSGSMLTPIYMRVLGEDKTIGLGFSSGTKMIVRTISNLIGGVAIGIINVDTFAFINAITFLVVFFVIFLIRKSLSEYEPQINEDRNVNLSNFFSHLFKSIKFILNITEISKFLIIFALAQSIMNLIVPVSAIMLIKNPFLGLESGQSISILTIALFIGVILGNLTSGTVFKNVNTRNTAIISQIMQIVILLGLSLSSFSIVLIGSLFSAISLGIMSPRLQESIFKLVPEDRMGSVESAINSFLLFIPGLLTIFLVFISSHYGVLYISIALGILLFLAILLALTMKFNFEIKE